MKNFVYAFVFLLSISVVHADPILLNGGDFGTNLRWTDANSNEWNSLGSSFNQPDPDTELVDINGANTGITISNLTGGISQGSSAVPTGNSSLGLLQNANEAGQYNFVNGSVETVTFAGLATDGTTYDFRIWGQKDAARSTKFQFVGSSTWNTGDNVDYLYLGDSPESDTITFSGMTPDSNGILTMSFNGNAGDGDFAIGSGSSFGYFGAAEITANVIPEPSSIALLALGFLVFIRISRRR